MGATKTANIVTLADQHTRVSGADGEAGKPTRDQNVFDTIAHFLRIELFPCSDHFSQYVLLTLYRLLAKGFPVSLAGLSAACGSDGRAVAKVVAEIAPSRLRYDEAGQIIAFGGLTQRLAKHRFVFCGQELFTWCAFDALFLPEILGGTAEVSSRCPVTGAKICMVVHKDRLESESSDGTVMSFVMPETGACRADLRGTFCDHVNFFASRRAADSWLEHNRGAAILSLDDAFALGRIRNDAGFKDVLTDQNLVPK